MRRKTPCFRGWHRPIWFDASRRNACVEAVAAHVDLASGRRVTDSMQVAPETDGEFVPVLSLSIDVDLVGIGGIDESAGTFQAEALVRIESDRDWLDSPAPACLRVLQAVEEPTWILSGSSKAR